MYLDQMAQGGENDNLIKGPQNPSYPEPKFEQLYIGNFLLLISTFVDMFITSNDDTTLSGASRRIDMHD